MDDLNIVSIKCSNCTASINVSTGMDVVICPYCNTRQKIDFSSKSDIKNDRTINLNDNSTSLFIGQSAKDPASVVIFIEDYIEKNKDSIKYDFNSIGIDQFKKVISEIKMANGTNKDTWKAEFLSIAEATKIRIDYLNELLDVIAKNITDNEMELVYSNFDAYCDAVNAINENKDEIVSNLDRTVSRYEKYGATQNEIDELANKKDEVISLIDNLGEAPNEITDIEKLKEAEAEATLKIEAELLQKGIDAVSVYNAAINAEENGDKIRALLNYASLGDYKDSRKRFSKLNTRVVVNDELFEVAGDVYVLADHKEEIIKNKRQLKKKEKEEKDNERHLNWLDVLEVRDLEAVEKEPLINNFQSFISTFGNYFYYVSKKGTIHRYDLKNKNDLELEKNAKHLEKDFCFSFDNDSKGLLLSEYEKDDLSKKEIKAKNKRIKKGQGTSDDLEPENANDRRIDILNYGNDSLFYEELIGHIEMPLEFYNGNYIRNNHILVMRYKYKTIGKKDKMKLIKTPEKILINLKTKAKYVDIVGPDDRIVDIIGNDLYYIQYAPTQYNLKLIRKDLQSLVETELLNNIFSVVKIKDNKIFYTIGNTRDTSLYNYDLIKNEKYKVLDGYVDGYVVYMDGYFYVSRGDKYNTTLFKIKEDGSTSFPLARNIDFDKYFVFKNGYFFYENIYGELIRVRIDGSRESVIATDLERIIYIDANYIYYSIFETTDFLYENPEIREGKKYRKTFSVYRYNIITDTSEKLIFGVDNYRFIPNSNKLYFYRINEETFRSLNMKKGKNFNYTTIETDYYVTDINNIEEKLILSAGLPHQDTKRGCAFFKKNVKVEFVKRPWVRPYLTKKEFEEE